MKSDWKVGDIIYVRWHRSNEPVMGTVTHVERDLVSVVIHTPGGLGIFYEFQQGSNRILSGKEGTGWIYTTQEGLNRDVQFHEERRRG